MIMYYQYHIQVLKKRLKNINNILFVVDEVHTILSWGKKFRRTFEDLDVVISIFKVK